MPKLPEQKARDFELLDKSTYSRGTLDKFKPPAIKHHLKLPMKPIVGLLILVVVLGGIYTISKTYFPDLLKKKAPAQAEVKPFEYPLNVNDVKFPSEFLKEKFLENFQKAAIEKDADVRYKLLEEDFVFLNGFYASTAAYDFRVQLEKYRDYMKKYYPKKVEAGKILYEFACIDKLCPGANDAKYPPEVEAIKKDLEGNKAINAEVRSAMIRNFDTAAIVKDKKNQANFYMSVLSSLFSEYERTNDEGIKNIYLKLKPFVESLGVKIPAQILLE